MLKTKFDFIRKHLFAISVIAIPMVAAVVASFIANPDGNLLQAAEAGARRGR